MAQWPNDKLSPFTETIVAATICGRALEHKQRQLMLQQLDLHHQGQSPEAALEFSRRHRSLAALSVQHTKVLSMRVISTLEHPDPLLIFAAMTAYTAVLTLGDTVASKSVGVESPTMQTIDSLLIESTQQSLSAVHELGGLIASLGHLNHFQVSHFVLFLFVLILVIMRTRRKGIYTSTDTNISTLLAHRRIHLFPSRSYWLASFASATRDGMMPMPVLYRISQRHCKG